MSPFGLFISTPTPPDPGTAASILSHLPTILFIGWIVVTIVVGINAWFRNESGLRWGLIVFFGGPLGVLLYLEFIVYE